MSNIENAAGKKPVFGTIAETIPFHEYSAVIFII
jgi:hypothetical protein